MTIEMTEPNLRPEQIESWGDIDPEYVDFSAPDHDESDELSEDEQNAETPSDGVSTGPVWTEYELWSRDLDEGDDWEVAARGSVADDFEVVVTGLNTASRIEFRLRLIDSNGRHSKWGDPVQITTPRDFSPPPVPTGLWVATDLGFTTGGWDGTLSGPFPRDFNFAQLYVQQMHPEGDPDGPSGDPYPVHRFPAEGRYMLGFLPFAEHRAFLTAWDTSRNESARSDYIYFTPEPVFDDSALQEALRELNEEILPEVNDRLEELNDLDLPGVKEDLRVLNEESIPGLEAALESGLSEINENVIPGLQGQIDSNQASLDTLNGEIIPGLSDDISAVGSSLGVLGGELTTLQGELTTVSSTLTTVQGDLSGLEGNLGSLQGDLSDLDSALVTGLESANEWREVGAISATSLRVGEWENFFKGAEDMAHIDDSSIWWHISGGNPWSFTTQANWGQSGPALIIPAGSFSPMGTTFRLTHRPSRFRVRPGDEITLNSFARFEIAGFDGTDWVNVGFRLTWRDYSGDLLSAENFWFENPQAGAGRSIEGVATVPSSDTPYWCDIEFYADAAGSGGLRYWPPYVRRRVDSTLLVDGTILTRHLTSNSVNADHLTANSVDTNHLRANSVTVDAIAANSITTAMIRTNAVNADKIAANSINADHLTANSVDTNHLRANSVTASQVSANSINADHLQVNSVGADQIIANSVGATHVQANTIAAQHLQVGITENQWLGGNDMSDQNLDSDRWQAANGSLAAWDYVSDITAGGDSAALRVNSPTGLHRIQHRGSRMKVNGGDSYLIEGWVRLDSQNYNNTDWTHVGLREIIFDESGSQLRAATLNSDMNPWTQKIEYSRTMPETAHWLELQFVINAVGSGRARIWPPKVRREESGVLLVDGAILSRHLTANSVEADHITANAITSAKIAANAVGADEITANAIRSNHVAANQISGDHITANAISADHIQANAIGANQIAANAVTASQIRAGAIDGMLITGTEIRGGTIIGGTYLSREDMTNTGGVRIVGNGLDVNDRTGAAVLFAGTDGVWMRGDLTAESVELRGILRVGLDGEGALVPTGDGRLRIQGRMPLASAGANDMFTYEISSSLSFGQTSANMSRNSWTVGYAQPAPLGNRGPITTAQVLSTAPRSSVSVATSGAQPEGFTAQATSIHDGSGGTGHPNQVWIRYYATWRN